MRCLVGWCVAWAIFAFSDSIADSLIVPCFFNYAIHQAFYIICSIFAMNFAKHNMSCLAPRESTRYGPVSTEKTAGVSGFAPRNVTFSPFRRMLLTERFSRFEPDELEFFELRLELVDFALDISKRLEIGRIRIVEALLGIGNLALEGAHLSLR